MSKIAQNIFFVNLTPRRAKNLRDSENEGPFRNKHHKISTELSNAYTHVGLNHLLQVVLPISTLPWVSITLILSQDFRHFLA